ncbi:MAG: tRNA pseudouridine(38-40) synthase TruA [Candidatus Gastranaerophilales bacterium]|nr:tRNA pseudouridine(38-40) synthase TruA [Candidatus Gastranaerophilales bacterium]
MRYIICFEFLGENFFGSQKQPDKRTVQEEIEKALCTLIKDKIKIIPSGRTDAKVSAEYQVAHFDINEEIENPSNFLYKLNCILPDDVKVFELKKTTEKFHAQKDAKYKHYRYIIQNNRVASVFCNNCNLFYPYIDLNVDRLNQALSYLIGHHDFSAFKSVCDNPYNDCNIYYAQAKEQTIKRQKFIFIDIIGNRFLYNMIRTIVGQLLLIERNNLEPKVMDEVLKSKDRAKAGQVVDASGLVLKYVGYDNVEEYIQKINSQKEGI